MKKKMLSILIILMLVIYIKNDVGVKASNRDFFYTSGTEIYDCNGKNYDIVGINLRNGIANSNTPSLPVTTSTTEKTYQELVDWGFNTARFLVNYQIFEDDKCPYVYKETGWEWIDQNIEWAKKYGINLIINMHVPQGGYQSDGSGFAIWEEENMNRLIALWRAIAERYANESIIMGYSLVNEPKALSKEHLYMWEELSNNIINAIREVDKNHICFVEPCSAKGGDGYLYPSVQLTNVAYETHVYPMNSIKSMREYAQNDAIRYGDSNISFVENNEKTEVKGIRTEYSELNEGETNGWGSVSKLVVAPDNSNNAYVKMTVGNLGDKEVIKIKNIKIYEYDINNQLLGKVYDSNNNHSNHYNKWSSTNNETNFNASYNPKTETVEICIEKEKGYMEFADNTVYRFLEVHPGYKYEINYDVELSKNYSQAVVKAELVFGKAEKVYHLDKEYMEQLINVEELEKELGAPVYIGEIGISRDEFETEDNSYKLVNDCADIIIEHSYGFAYYAYHCPVYGLYTSSYKKVENMNWNLLKFFKAKMNFFDIQVGQ